MTVFNDAGPIVVNLLAVGDVAARAGDWQFGRFFPASCIDCSPFGQQMEFVKRRLENDNTIREAFYSTDGDLTNRFYVKVPTQELYRDLLLMERGAINALYPDRYKLFLRSGDAEHTALQRPTFYLGTANGVPLYEWTADFIVPRPFWENRVDEFVPLP